MPQFLRSISKVFSLGTQHHSPYNFVSLCNKGSILTQEQQQVKFYYCIALVSLCLNVFFWFVSLGKNVTAQKQIHQALTDQKFI